MNLRKQISQGKIGLVAMAVLAMGALLLAMPTPGQAASKKPIKIGVLAPFSAIDGISIVNDGHPIKLITYDDHASASDGVRGFQRAVQQDHVAAVVGTFISEVALAVEPWVARLHTPFLITGAASTKITKYVHNDYKHYKYVFHDNLNSAFLGDVVCGASHDILVKDFHYKTAVVMSEDAAWTQPLDNEYLKCLPKAGLKVVKHIRFSYSCGRHLVF